MPADFDFSTVSNLAVTDHLPADIIRSLWLIQSLNLRSDNIRNDLKQIYFDLRKLIPKPITKGNDRRNRRKPAKSTKTSQKQTNPPPNPKINRLYEEAHELEKQLEVTNSEALAEAHKIASLLRSSRQDIQEQTRRLVLLYFDSHEDATKLREFVDTFTDRTTCTRISLIKEGPWPEEMNKSVTRALKSTPELQRPNDSTVTTHFGESDKEMKRYILRLLDHRLDPSYQSARRQYMKERLVLSIMAKNMAFDQTFGLNGQRPAEEINTSEDHWLSESDLVTPKSAMFGPVERDEPGKAKETNEEEKAFEVEVEKDAQDVEMSRKEPEPVEKSLATKLEVIPSTPSKDGAAKVLPTIRISLGKSSSRERKKVSPSQPKVSLQLEDQNIDEEVYCICRTGSSGKMIGCDDPACKYGGWFHYKCLGLHPSFEPSKREKWYCPWCRDKHIKIQAKPSRPSLHRVSLRREDVPRIDDIDALLRKKRKTAVGPQNGNSVNHKDMKQPLQKKAQLLPPYVPIPQQTNATTRPTRTTRSSKNLSVDGIKTTNINIERSPQTTPAKRLLRSKLNRMYEYLNECSSPLSDINISDYE